VNKKLVAGIVLLILIFGAGGYYLRESRKKEPTYRTEDVSRGNVRATVTATGTVNAVTTVQVGTQVSGTIKGIYVDFNAPVKKGELLAQIDPAIFEAQVQQARANLLQAKANEAKAEASLSDAKRSRDRYRMLFQRNLVAQGDLDAAETNAQVFLSQLSAASAQVAQTRAALSLAETNLRYTRILSPVDGTVISRNVDVGQTVAASFQTPTLFTIAQDLKRMQIDTNVDEADIGKVKVRMPVEFTVDAYPDSIFQGRVAEVRIAPINVQNVVTYDVVVRVDNPDMRLKPGMTANVSVILADKAGVLRVPNGALRFRPAEDGRGLKPVASRGREQAVWVLRDNTPQRVAVTPGISDGTFTEIHAGTLREGEQVILETLKNKKKDNGSSSSPRVPRMF